MNRQAIFFGTFLVSIFVATAPALAVIEVLGSNDAHDCFLAAKAALQPDSGIVACNKALRDDILNAHDRAGTLVNRGVLEVAKGLLDKAIADYNTSIRLSPDLGDAYVDRGAVLINLKRYDEALVDIDKGMSLGLAYPHLGYYDRAVAEELTGRLQESYDDFKRVLTLDPTFTLARDQLKNFIVTTKKTAPE